MFNGKKSSVGNQMGILIERVALHIKIYLTVWNLNVQSGKASVHVGERKRICAEMAGWLLFSDE